MEPLLEINHLTIAYEEVRKEVVKDCSLSLDEQEILGIVGESGSGKTTLVMSILGLLSESPGSTLPVSFFRIPIHQQFPVSPVRPGTKSNL